MFGNGVDRAWAPAVLAVGLLLAGCSNSGLTTSSLLAGNQPAAGAAAPAAPIDPLARPVHVATTSAQAVKCGFFFDPQKLRANLMVVEAQGGVEQAGKAEKAYDTTFRLLSDKLRGEGEYCTDERTTEIKARLQRHLAGDFAPPAPKPKPADDGWFYLPPNDPGPLDREKIFDPGPRGKSS